MGNGARAGIGGGAAALSEAGIGAPTRVRELFHSARVRNPPHALRDREVSVPVLAQNLRVTGGLPNPSGVRDSPRRFGSLPFKNQLVLSAEGRSSVGELRMGMESFQFLYL